MTTLVTGAFGCLGAEVVRQLLAEGERPVLLDFGDDPWRLRMIAGRDVTERVPVIRADVAELADLARIVREHDVRRMIHLAAWQIPLCRRDPSMGARVNVVGTANALEVARLADGRVERVVYMSSIAVYGPPHLYPPGPLANDAPPHPTTHYGVYKVANEGTARVHWAEHRVPSIGFRLPAIYGPGRDVGLTADPTLAMKAALLERKFAIRWSGRSALLYTKDAAASIIRASRSTVDGARVYNLRGSSVDNADIVPAIERAWPAAKGLVTWGGDPVPFPDSLDDSRFQAEVGPVPVTPFDDGVRETMETFARLQQEGRLDARELA
ncbi:MAG: NAD(P)-dependent oxidoreductase [Candidatus Rokubacteria bacterium]|nr:NAD(P)-dependent oxidoreductase [Candidatus Rokubacteria bacterium]